MPLRSSTARSSSGSRAESPAPELGGSHAQRTHLGENVIGRQHHAPPFADAHGGDETIERAPDRHTAATTRSVQGRGATVVVERLQGVDVVGQHPSLDALHGAFGGQSVEDLGEDDVSERDRLVAFKPLSE
jgi:hypothetical protein